MVHQCSNLFSLSRVLGENGQGGSYYKYIQNGSLHRQRSIGQSSVPIPYRSFPIQCSASKMEKLELVFVPSPLMGHVGQLVELAKFMINRFDHISASVLVMKLPTDPIGNTYTESISSFPTTNRIRFHQVPQLDFNPEWSYRTPGDLADIVIELHKPDLRDMVEKLMRDQSSRLAAFVVDMFCTSIINVGKEFGISTYVFFTSNAAFLGLMLHLQTLHDKHGQDISELKYSDTELIIPSYATPVAPSVLPFVLTDKLSWSNRFVRFSRMYKEAKGIVINTFAELECHALGSYDSETPPVYPVGPILKTAQPVPLNNNDILQWLDGQPDSSVVFLCFGSRGCFNPDQVKEIAVALERSGFRFLWSLRKPAAVGIKGFPIDYEDVNEVLPDGFSDRTVGIGKIIGWAPQTALLSHRAVGGFVSHCGWNSILESIWCGVPIATWPLYAEQQIDAYQLVKELGLGVEISLDYDQQVSTQTMVKADVIEKGIRGVMDRNSKVRKRVEEMREKSVAALKEGGSSYAYLQCLVDDLI